MTGGWRATRRVLGKALVVGAFTYLAMSAHRPTGQIPVAVGGAVACYLIDVLVLHFSKGIGTALFRLDPSLSVAEVTAAVIAVRDCAVPDDARIRVAAIRHAQWQVTRYSFGWRQPVTIALIELPWVLLAILVPALWPIVLLPVIYEVTRLRAGRERKDAEIFLRACAYHLHRRLAVGLRRVQRRLSREPQALVAAGGAAVATTVPSGPVPPMVDPIFRDWPSAV